MRRERGPRRKTSRSTSTSYELPTQGGWRRYACRGTRRNSSAEPTRRSGSPGELRRVRPWHVVPRGPRRRSTSLGSKAMISPQRSRAARRLARPSGQILLTYGRYGECAQRPVRFPAVVGLGDQPGAREQRLPAGGRRSGTPGYEVLSISQSSSPELRTSGASSRGPRTLTRSSVVTASPV